MTRVFSLVADFHGTSDSENLPRPVYQTVKIPKTKQFDAFLEQVGIRVENVRSKRVSYGKDNMLKITVDGRKAALDLRLTEGVLQEVQPCKIEQCAQNIWQVYQKTRMCRGTQIVFCDLSVPKAGFNVYDELKRILMMKGIPEEKIAFIHDANTLEQRRELASKMEEGDIAVLIGSTFRMGVGMNIQKRLAALHHLDIPWRPADVTQREGRIIRQGNLNQEVYIFRYITEGSFDAYSWQLLETKQRIIDGLLSGYLTKRSTSDVADSILSYGEVKALAIGNPLMRERVEKANELSRLLVLQEKSREERFWLSGRLEKIPGEIREQKQKVTMGEKDIERYVQCRRKYNSAQRAKIREQIGEYVRGEKLGGSIAYQGFTLEFPDTVFLKEPYVWVRGDGSYYLRLSEDAAGSLARVDHFLENLPEKTEEYRTKKRTLEEEQRSIRQDLSRFESYYERVEACLREIKRLDEELGVDLS